MAENFLSGPRNLARALGLEGMFEETITRLKGNIQKTIDYQEARTAYWAKWAVRDSKSTWNKVGSQFQFAGPDGHVFGVADGEVISVVTWDDEKKEAGTWIWGHVLQSKPNYKIAPQISYDAAERVIPDIAPFFDKLTFRVREVTMRMIECTCVEVHKYDATLYIASGDKNGSEAIWGLRNTKAYAPTSSVSEGAAQHATETKLAP